MGVSAGSNSPGLSSRRSPLQTNPAMISAWALLRVSASPRCTKDASSLWRAPLALTGNVGVRALKRRGSSRDPRSGACRDGAILLPKRRHGRLHDVARVEPGLVVLLDRRVMVDEAVGKHHRADLEALIELPRNRQMVQHLRRESTDRGLLDRDQHLVLAREPVDQ